MKRGSGLLMHVSSLWGDYSHGSFGKSAKEWIDFLEQGGFSYWQVLPFCLPDDFHSPYRSYSAFSVNPYFIDLPTLYEQGLITKKELEEAKQKTPYSCEFERLDSERMALLARAAQRFTDDDALDAFLQSHPQIEHFCRFMALKQANDLKAWTEWTVTEPKEEDLRVWRFTQYEFYRQWAIIKDYANKKGISIIGDIPIYVAYDSADVWANPDGFQLDERLRPTAVAGVPPDYFCEDGQLWGNPLYDWDKMKQDGYAWWCERVRAMGELFDGVRIDHFRAFSSYYSIEADAETAKNGVWKKGPGMDLIRALRSATDRLLIAEDLGDIDDGVVQLVKDSACPGMRILQFAFLGDPHSPHLPHNYCENCVAYTGTHDNNTLLGYVWEASPTERRALFDYCGYESEDIHHCYDAIFRTMFASHAFLTIFPIQDLLLYGRDTRINIPGRSDGNWSYRLTRDQLDRLDCKKYLALNRRYGRI